MLIVAGWIRVDPTHRKTYLDDSLAVVQQARSAPGCLDFAMSADVVDPGRINVHERWDTESSLLAFRGDGPNDDQLVAVLDADVHRYEIAAVESA
ncbi:MAG: antibiotic biosynthesis monooxygenase family protein [Aeromicrobium sp.]|uniref:putative quinol monooxygenase n=1 Tax=Aeromicrobium sp. TaxID=1871063 RepID=UPI003C5FA8AB